MQHLSTSFFLAEHNFGIEGPCTRKMPREQGFRALRITFSSLYSERARPESLFAGNNNNIEKFIA